jgi:hypothetical protein
MSREQDVAAARSAFDNLASRYAAMKSRAEAAVVRQVVADGRIADPQPLWIERLGGRFGKAVKHPADRPGVFVHGFDAEDRLVLLRENTKLPNAAYETFIDYAPDAIVSARFGYDPDHTPESHARIALSDGRPVSAAYAGPYSHGFETYAWDGGLITQIAIEHEEDGEAQRSVVAVEYDSFGRAVLLEERHDNGYSRVLLDRRSGQPSPHDLAEVMLSWLLPAVRARLDALPAADPVKAVALVYDDDLRAALPPLLAVATEADLAGWGDTARQRIWEPADYRLYETPEVALEETPASAASCEALNRAAAEKSDAKLVVEPLLEACRRLAASLTARLAPDAVVFATDMEGAHLAANRKALKLSKR